MNRSVSSLFSWLLMPVAALLVAAAVSLPQRAYTGLLVRGAEVISVLPGSPGARAGARPHDRIVPTPGTPLGPDLSSLSTRIALGRPFAVTVDRDGEAHTIWLVPAPLPDGDRRMMAALLLVGAGFVLLGGWVWSERRDVLTRTFLLLCLGFAWMLAPLPQLSSRLAAAGFEVVQAAVNIYLPALFVHFFALFPDREPRGGVSAAVRAGYVLATALFAASLGIQFGHMAGLTLDALSMVFQATAAVWFAAGLATALGLFASAFGSSASGDARRRLRVTFVGTVLGAAPFAAFILIRNLAPSVSVPGEGSVVLLTLLVPASFAWATVVHSVFDFRIALRIGVVTVLLAALGATLYVAGEWLAAAWWPDLGAGIAGTALALLTLGMCIAGPLAPWMRRMGSRMVPAADAVSLAAWVARDLGQSEHSVERVLSEACDSIRRALRLDGCALVTLDAATARVAALAGSFGGTLPSTLPDLDAGAIGRDGVRRVDQFDLNAPARAAFERADVRWLLPVGRDPVRAVALLGRRLAGSWLGTQEVFELERFAEHLAITLENSALRHEAHERNHLDRELREAGAIQAHLLPRRAPVFPTLDCAAAALSSESVGGDYYDFVEGPGRDFTLVVGDAAGKGVPAALVLAGVQARFRSEARKGLTPGQLLEGLNRELVGLEQPEKFVGLLCARFEVRGGRMCFANAGLTPPLLRRRDGTFEELTSGGVLLGVSLGASYPDECVYLGAGDLVVIYSDGLTEARRGDALFGVEGVRRVLDEHAPRRAADILDALLSEVRAFADRPLDDVTVVVLRQLTGSVPERVPATQISLKPARWATEDIG